MPCIFCGIVEGKQPAQIVFRDPVSTAFKDIRPKAPLHLLVVPNKHIESLNDLGPADEALVGHLLRVVRDLAAREPLAREGYQVHIHVGPGGGQEIYHLHLHLLAGRF